MAMHREKRAVCLLSGGLDSAVAAAWAQREGFVVVALTVAYGQAHAAELEAADRVAASLGIADHRRLDVDLASFGGSALTGDGAIPKNGAAGDDAIPPTYVPGRNAVLVALALSLAEALDADAVVYGANAVDYSGYPDCRPGFVAAMGEVARVGTKRGVEGSPIRVLAPLIDWSKAAIIERGLEWGVDFAVTRSCYDPGAAGAPCGSCDSCRIRAAGFVEAGARDPALGG